MNIIQLSILLEIILIMSCGQPINKLADTKRSNTDNTDNTVNPKSDSLPENGNYTINIFEYDQVSSDSIKQLDETIKNAGPVENTNSGLSSLSSHLATEAKCVKIQNMMEGTSRNNCNSNGFFTFNKLNPGLYKITSESTGQQTYVTIPKDTSSEKPINTSVDPINSLTSKEMESKLGIETFSKAYENVSIDKITKETGDYFCKPGWVGDEETFGKVPVYESGDAIIDGMQEIGRAGP